VSIYLYEQIKTYLSEFVRLCHNVRLRARIKNGCVSPLSIRRPFSSVLQSKSTPDLSVILKTKRHRSK